MKKTLLLILAAMLFLSAAAQDLRHGRHSMRSAAPLPRCEVGEPLPPMPPVASPEQVDLIALHLRKLGSDNDRLDVAMLCLRLVGVPVAGLGVLAGEFSFDDSRLAFLKFAYGFCPDREGFWVLRDCLSFQSNGDELIRFIREECR